MNAERWTHRGDDFRGYLPQVRSYCPSILSVSDTQLAEQRVQVTQPECCLAEVVPTSLAGRQRLGKLPAAGELTTHSSGASNRHLLLPTVSQGQELRSSLAGAVLCHTAPPCRCLRIFVTQEPASSITGDLGEVKQKPPSPS